jgi:hypothetical protein
MSWYSEHEAKGMRGWHWCVKSLVPTHGFEHRVDRKRSWRERSTNTALDSWGATL